MLADCRLTFGALTESSARVSFRLDADERFELESGQLRGPFCEHARTLATDFALTANEARSAGDISLQAVVSDPCYWSPDLPHLYELAIRGRRAGKTMTERRFIGLRRWAVERESFYLNRRRTVLRGGAMGRPWANRVSEARDAGAALLIPAPSEDDADLADRQGLALVADLRDSHGDAMTEVMRLSWHPSVVAVLADRDDFRPCDAERWPKHLPLAISAYSDDEQAAPAGYPSDDPFGSLSFAGILAVELGSDSMPRLPSGKAILAIRREGFCEDFAAVRAACDRLQAELAPEFDLAGYFVRA